MDEPETRYARSGDVSIAYQVLGDGPFDVVYIPPFVSHLELAWEVPSLAAYFRRLASFCRLIRLDKRGTGMSDRVSGAPTLETRMDDVRAVMDAAGSARAAVLGVSEGGPMAILFAAIYPERAWALVLEGANARYRWAPDYPWGWPEEEEVDLDGLQERWGSREQALALVHGIAPSLPDAEREAAAQMMRQSASPGAVAALTKMNAQIDVRHALSAVRTPTLVLNRDGESDFVVRGSRYLAEHIPGALHVEVPGTDHAHFAGDAESTLDALEGFLRGAWERSSEEAEPDRVLATVLFTDIVGSSAKVVALGDRAWRELLERHHGLVRRQLAQFRGREVDTAGDGFFASFDGPARAIRCACAIVDGVRELGIEVRAGLHTGECELANGKVAGIAVHTGARVAAHAQPGEVLVSSTVKDLVAGSGLAFDDRGSHELKGIPGEWRLFAVDRVGA